MKKPTISTIVIIICILIIGLYAMGEVNYFSSKIAVEKNIDSPTILIPKIGVNEKINNVSLNQGVLSDPGANIPTQDYVTLYGHRTLQGSPFFRLNEIEAGDLLVLEWPGVGEINYTVTNTTIVPGTSDAVPSFPRIPFFPSFLCPFIHCTKFYLTFRMVSYFQWQHF